MRVNKATAFLNDVTEAFSAIGASVFAVSSNSTGADLGWRLFVRTLELIWGITLFVAIVSVAQGMLP